MKTLISDLEGINQIGFRQLSGSIRLDIFWLLLFVANKVYQCKFGYLELTTFLTNFFIFRNILIISPKDTQ
jgi:hypothetical protein